MSIPNYSKFTNPKDSCFMVEFKDIEILNKKKNHITQYAKNRINYLKYAEEVLKSLNSVDNRFKGVSALFIKEVIIPALGMELAVANKQNKSKNEVYYPSYCLFLRGINYFHKAYPEKISLNKEEISILAEVDFVKNHIKAG